MSAPKLPYNTADDKDHILSLLSQLDPAHKWQVQITKISDTRTNLQNRSLHKYISLLCDALNDRGYTFKVVLNRRAHDAIKACDNQIVKDKSIDPRTKATIFGCFDYIKRALDYADTDWTPALVKDCIWRLIQEAITNKESSAEMTTVEIQKVYKQVDRFMSESFGIHIQWPSLESMSEEQR